MEAKSKNKRKAWWIAGGLTTLFVLSQMGGSGRPSSSTSSAPDPVAAHAAPPSDPAPVDPEPLPTVDAPPEDVTPPAPEPEPDLEPQPDVAEESVSADTYYRNCSAARAAGVTPISVGEPGYASHLDRDGDGIACE